MTLYNRAALYIQGTGEWLYLPPWGPLRAMAARRVVGRQYDLARASITDLGARIKGTDIEIAGEYVESSYETGMLYQQKLMDIFWDGRTARKVDVQLWEDTSTPVAIKRTWRDCRIQADVEFGDVWGEDESNRTFTMSLFTSEIAPGSTVTGGLVAPEGPYEAYLYGGAEAAATVRGYDVMNVAFEAGIAEVTTADNAAIWQRVMIPSSDRPYRVTGIMQIGCAGLYGTTGSTVARISDTDHASAGNYLECTADYDEAQSAKATGSIYCAAGSSLYLYLPGTGGHNIPVFQINIEVL